MPKSLSCTMKTGSGKLSSMTRLRVSPEGIRSTSRKVTGSPGTKPVVESTGALTSVLVRLLGMTCTDAPVLSVKDCPAVVVKLAVAVLASVSLALT